MNTIYACIDGLKTTAAVIDWAAWSAQRLGAPLALLHVLERDPDSTAVTDFSGAIGLGAQETLLKQLSDLDAQRGKLAQEAGRQMLARAEERAKSAGAQQVQGFMRHGSWWTACWSWSPTHGCLCWASTTRCRASASCTWTTMSSA